MKETLSRRAVIGRAAAVGTGLLGIGQPGGVPAVGAVKVPEIDGTVNSASGLNLHSSPGVDEPVLVWLEDGTSLTVLATSGDWFRVETGQATGWVSSWYVLLHGTPSNMIVQGDPSLNRVALTFDCDMAVLTFVERHSDGRHSVDRLIGTGICETRRGSSSAERGR